MSISIPCAWANTYGFQPVGFTTTMATLDPKNFKRSYATTVCYQENSPGIRILTFLLQAFYLPNKDKPNFKVLCDALVHRIVMSGTDGNLFADTVEFEHSGRVHRVHARKEVILAAGAIHVSIPVSHS